MTRSELINAVLEEMDRVWGEYGLGGEPSEYAWLLENFNLSEEDDVQWQLILPHSMNDLPDEDMDDEELMKFLEDDRAVIKFLQDFLKKYKGSPASYASRDCLAQARPCVHPGDLHAASRHVGLRLASCWVY